MQKLPADRDEAIRLMRRNRDAIRRAQARTRLENLGPLTRFVHRAKTHGGWKLDQPESGLFVWTSPLGHRYLVARSHTIALDAPEEVVPLVA